MGYLPDVKRDAYISKCANYRYLLSRTWFENTCSPAMIFWKPIRQIVFVMLNPSTADAYEDDPTIRRCVGFGQRDEFHCMHVANLFAGRATKPDDLFKMYDPIGPEQLRTWQKIKDSSPERTTIICAWGADKRAKEQAKVFLEFMGDRELHCLGTTKDGSPRHPLYLKSDTEVVLYSPPPTLRARTAKDHKARN